MKGRGDAARNYTSILQLPYSVNGVATTYRKWRYEIANGFDKKSRYKKYTNAIAEGLNNQLKTIIKSAYGYHNFDRFRKRSMLIMTYSNKHKKKA